MGTDICVYRFNFRPGFFLYYLFQKWARPFDEAHSDLFNELGARLPL